MEDHFQERPEAKTERRWLDRLIPDGSWSGNVYDFFRKVYLKLTADLKVPFQLQHGQSIEDTPVHEALREALANTLIHADFSGRVSVLVVKRPDMFGFRNPGLMRVPLVDAIKGGTSDYRNRRLQTMFQQVGCAQEPYLRDTRIPTGFDWPHLKTKVGEPLEAQYLATLHKLGQEPGMLGAIFFKTQNKIQDPAKLSRLVQLIDAESWVGMDADTKGDLYEGLLQKNAEDTKSGVGQYFTPRALIQAMVECVRPEPLKSIADPACGTGGFFLGAQQWLLGQNLNRKAAEFLRNQTFHGNEIVAGTRRMCLMNLFLHNIGDLTGEPTVDRADALITDPGQRFDYVLANPPFGKKSSMTITNAEGDEDRDALTYERQDFWETTSNKQLNFLQHKASLDIFWLKDDSLDNLDDLSPPDVLQQEIIDHLEAALAAFRDVAAGLPCHGLSR